MIHTPAREMIGEARSLCGDTPREMVQVLSIMRQEEKTKIQEWWYDTRKKRGEWERRSKRTLTPTLSRRERENPAVTGRMPVSAREGFDAEAVVRTS